MARQLLFVQGGGETAHDAWDSKLVDSLGRALGAAYDIRYPRMPDEGDPKFARWKAALREAFTALGDDAVLVGHSIGATILVHSLAEAPPRRPPVGLFLVAPPFVGEGGWPSDEIAPKPNLGARLPAGTAVYIYRGEADETVPAEHLDLYARAIPQATIRKLARRDHQLNNDLSEVAADIRDLLAGAKP
jgi:predicted alpha/beta hydrolase family esterase